MQTRTFQAANMMEAMHLVKTELGPDAMIVSSRKERRKGILGFFSRPVFSITAALAPVQKTASPYPADGHIPAETARDEFRKAMLEPLARELKELRERVDDLFRKERAERQEQRTGPDRELPAGEEAAVTPLAFKTLKGAPDAATGASPETDRAGILSEVSSALHAAGLSETTIRALAERAGVNGINPVGAGELKGRLKQGIEAAVKCSGQIKLKKSGARVVALVGPTGVGKTTTIAKLAAQYTLNRKARIALITIDTFRVGAVEQLKTYSRIMGVPLEIATSPGDLQKALDLHADKDLVLVDTVGRSPRDKETIDELRKMLDTTHSVEIHLCVAATTRESELRSIVKSFRALPLTRLLFTKLDESSSFGSILNLHIENRLPLSYFTRGQRVPEDIEPATPGKVAELLLGE